MYLENSILTILKGIITLEYPDMLFNTRNNVTIIPPLPGTIFGEIKNERDVSTTNPEQGK